MVRLSPSDWSVRHSTTVFGCTSRPTSDSDALLMGIERLRWMGSGFGSSVDQKWAAAMADLLTEMPDRDEMLKARASVVLADRLGISQRRHLV